MKSKYNIVSLLFILFLFTSCNEDWMSQVVEVDIPPHDPKLVSYCFLDVQDQAYKIKLSRSAEINDDSDLSVREASILLSENNVPFVSEFYSDSTFIGFIWSETGKEDSLFSYQFVSDEGKSISAGNSYTLDIASPGYESVMSAVVAPGQIELSSIAFEEDGIIDPDGYKSDEIKVEFSDPGEEKNYYIVSAQLQLIYDGWTDQQDLWLSAVDPRLEEVYNVPFFDEHGVSGMMFSDEEGFEGTLVQLRLSTFIWNENPDHENKLRVRLYHISKSLYDFLKAHNSYEDSSEFGIFAEPIVMPSNFENGYGVFGIYNHHEMEIEL